jgi:N-acetyl-gamma-glutamyl-phosphate reductase
MARIGILGATGYAGVELALILERHPEADVVFVTSESNAGQLLTSVFPRLSGCRKVGDLALRTAAQCADVSVDVVFSCLPHGASAEIVLPFVEGGALVIDLSADFRLGDPADYPRWYGKPHPRPQALSRGVYSITELHRSRLSGARLVANPGCYPTSVLLPLVPLLREGLVGSGPVIADSKSGVSGAGRKASLSNSFCEVDESFSAYKVGRSHQHLGEMLQELSATRPGGLPLIFTPHLVPMERGILTTLYVPLAPGRTGSQAREILAETYRDEPFVRVLSASAGLPATNHVSHSNRAHLAVSELPEQDVVVVVSVLDNLIKGASGQAVQNWNAVSGFPETLGLLP